jgi:AhpD family alkylhydroperoxidase
VSEDTKDDPDRAALSARVQAFGDELRRGMKLRQRLVELVRLRIAFHNQCRPCMSMRYGTAVDDGVTEGVVCSLENPAEAPDLSAAERAALAFADRFATDHLSIDAGMLAELRRHFDPQELAELGALAAFFTGFGRMGAVFDGGQPLPVGFRKEDGSKLTPWRVPEPVIVR